MIGSFIARPVGLVLTGPVATLVGYRGWLTVVGAVIMGSVLVALTSGDVRRLERRNRWPGGRLRSRGLVARDYSVAQRRLVALGSTSSASVPR